METWKPIPEFEDKYMASDKGRIKSIIREKPLILKQMNHRNGHKYVNLMKNGKIKKKYVHRLVALAFIPNPKNKRCVLHKDDIKDNNSIDNLYWGTQKDNMADRMKNGNGFEGEKHWHAKLTRNDVLQMKEDRKNGMDINQLDKKYPIHKSNIRRILKGHLWSHL